MCSNSWHGGVFSVGAASHPDDAVAGLEAVHFAGGAEEHDCSFCFATEDFGFRGGVEPCSEVAGRCQYYVVKGREGRATCRCN